MRIAKLAIIVAVGTAIACGDRTPPVLGAVVVAQPSEHTPLAALLTFSTDEPGRVSLAIADGERTWTVTPGHDYRTDHEVPVLGLRPDRSHDVTVIVSDAAGNETSAPPVTIRTDPLPEDFPPLDVRVSKPEAMEPGVTLFGMFRWPDGGPPDQTFGLLIAVDAAGDVVWYHRTDEAALLAIRLRNGNILYNTSPGGVRGALVEIDLLGDVKHRWRSRGVAAADLADAILVDVDSIHHDVLELPSGDFAVFSTEIRTFEDYPTSDEDPDAVRTTQDVVGDVVVEFARDGTVVNRWHLLDLVDPYRVGYGSLENGFWRSTYQALMEDEPNVVDWAHANALFYDRAEDAYLVALRHQDAIVKLDRATGQIAWILGPHSGWNAPWSERLLQPRGDMEWAYHSHGLELTPQGTLLMYDNGNNRASAFEDRILDSDAFSRAVEFEVDAEAMEVRQVWSYQGAEGEPFYSSFLSDADWLPMTGNVLITDGARVTQLESDTEDSPAHQWARILEVTHTSPAEIVFELVIDDDPPTGWRVYRAGRLRSLYPEP